MICCFNFVDLVIFDAVKCSSCGLIVHRKCLAKMNIVCGPNSQRLTADKDARRMSIFGVPLKGHLEAQHRRIPLILDKCVNELQARGMTCKVCISEHAFSKCVDFLPNFDAHFLRCTNSAFNFKDRFRDE